MINNSVDQQDQVYEDGIAVDQFEHVYEDSTLTREESEDAQSTIDPNIPAEISYRVIDPDVYSLVRRYEKQTIVVPNFGQSKSIDGIENFQRGFVWRRNQMDRFLETLLLKYPIPGIILIDRGKDPEAENNRDIWYVLDGQQRITTLYKFLREDYRISSSSQVLDKYRGKRFKDLPQSEQDQLENYAINTTVIKSVPNSNNLSAIYKIYERINSGGTQLTPHEIRIAIYSGKLANRIEELNNQDTWRNIYGPKNDRLRDHEMISRILAMYTDWTSYNKPLKGFLNDFYQNNKAINDDLEEAITLFNKTTKILSESQSKSALRRGSDRRPINIAASEAIYVAIMVRLASGLELNKDQANEILNNLWDDEKFGYYVEGPTSDTFFVRARMSIAISAFLPNTDS